MVMHTNHTIPPLLGRMQGPATLYVGLCYWNIDAMTYNPFLHGVLPGTWIYICCNVNKETDITQAGILYHVMM